MKVKTKKLVGPSPEAIHLALDVMAFPVPYSSAANYEAVRVLSDALIFLYPEQPRKSLGKPQPQTQKSRG